jgi:hypothetical protein
MNAKTIISAVLILLLGACAGPEHLGSDFGNSYRINATVQVQDPDAQNHNQSPAASDGQKIEQALKDYRTGRPMEAREHLIVESGK